MTIDKQAVGQIVARIVHLAQPERVILFGSAATGTMTPDSDLDLLVIERIVPDIREESLRLRSALQGSPLPIDLVVMTAERFEETKNVVGGIAYPAHKYGRVVYEAA